MANAYKSSLEHLTDELKRLDLMLKLNMSNIMESELQSEAVYTAEEIYSLLDSGDTSGQDNSYPEAALDEIDNIIKSRLEASSEDGIQLSVPYVSKLLNLSSLEEKCIIICIAPELNRKYEKIYGFFQNDMTVKSPSIDFVLSLLTSGEEERIAARRSFDAQAPLIRFLMEPSDELKDTSIPLIARHLKLDDWVVNFLLDIRDLDTRLSRIAELIPANIQSGGIVAGGVEESIVRFAEYYLNNKERSHKQIFYFYGPDAMGMAEHVKNACVCLQMPLIAVDTQKMLASEIDFGEILRLLGRQVMMENAVLCLENFECMISEDENKRFKLNALIASIQNYASITFILGSSQWNPVMTGEDTAFVGVEFSFPTENERKAYWEKFSMEHRLAENINLDNFSGNFRFTPDQIRSALNFGESISVWRGAEDGMIGSEELSNACYEQSNRKLGTLAAKIKKTYTWDMLVLPSEQMSQMEEICNQVKLRGVVYEQWGFDKRLSLGKGLNVLFSGPPGSGKTMAAEVIANELGLEIYKIDVSQVVSKYIGETEKNLDKIFSEAETSNAILFFDEADALFGKRSEVKDAHDRYANVEISYLLQRMEDYKGIVILATNLNQNIDDAFLRRLHFNVAFPFPEKGQRELIWKGIFPAGAPVDNQLDYDFLAEKFILAGGNIKNIALNAAFYAAHEACPIGIKHIMLSAKREYKKMGKTFVKSDFSPYYELIEVMA
jgi:hypothetical protein